MIPSDSAAGYELHALFREVFALHRALAARMDAVHAAAGLSTPNVKVLSILERRGAATVPEVAAAHGVSRQFVLTVCRELEARGLIVFSDNPRHRRSKLARLTDAGAAAVARFHRAEAGLIAEALPDFDRASVAAATILLQEIRSRIA